MGTFYPLHGTMQQMLCVCGGGGGGETNRNQLASVRVAWLVNQPLERCDKSNKSIGITLLYLRSVTR